MSRILLALDAIDGLVEPVDLTDFQEFRRLERKAKGRWLVFRDGKTNLGDVVDKNFVLLWTRLSIPHAGRFTSVQLR